MPPKSRADRRRAARTLKPKKGPKVGFIVFVCLLAAAGIAAIVLQRRAGAPSLERPKPPAGVKTFADLKRDHVQTPVQYPQTPPVGGEHAPAWANCGFYSSPVPSENAVHSMEHGAVWITYAPDLPAKQVDEIRKLTRSTSYVLASPFAGLPSKVAASAWGVQKTFTSASDPKLAQFVKAYRQGPQTPELGATCTGGVGTPD